MIQFVGWILLSFGLLAVMTSAIWVATILISPWTLVISVPFYLGLTIMILSFLKEEWTDFQ